MQEQLLKTALGNLEDIEAKFDKSRKEMRRLHASTYATNLRVIMNLGTSELIKEIDSFLELMPIELYRILKKEHKDIILPTHKEVGLRKKFVIGKSFRLDKFVRLELADQGESYFKTITYQTQLRILEGKSKSSKNLLQLAKDLGFKVYLVKKKTS